MPPVDRRNPIRAASSESTCSLLEFAREFPDDEACLTWLWRERFAPHGEHAHCSRCDKERVFKRYGTAQKRPAWFCRTCGFRIHPLKGTIFERSSTSLQLWFYALYIMASTRCGISAKQLERELGVTYKTAWRMFNLIRNQLMVQDDAPLSGEVEADETYVGGKPRQSERNALMRQGIVAFRPLVAEIVPVGIDYDVQRRRKLRHLLGDHACLYGGIDFQRQQVACDLFDANPPVLVHQRPSVSLNS